MEAKQEYSSIKKELKQNDKSRRKLIKKQQKTIKQITIEEKERATKDRVTFINNIQVHRVPNLITKKRPRALLIDVDAEDEDVDARAAREAREYVFSIEDLFTLITTQLGPIEYYMFSRTSRAMGILLKDSFPVWARLFLNRLEQETVKGEAFVTEKRELISIVGALKTHKNTDACLFVFLPKFLHLWQHTFVRYRPRNKPSNTLFMINAEYSPLFLEDTKSDAITRPLDHNFLIAKGRPAKEIRERKSEKYEKKYGCDISAAATETNIDFFHYKDLNKLHLTRPASIRDALCFNSGILYHVEPEHAKITAFKQTNFRLWYLMVEEATIGKWTGPLFCDEYEVRSRIRRAPFLFSDPRLNPDAYFEIGFLMMKTK